MIPICMGMAACVGSNSLMALLDLRRGTLDSTHNDIGNILIATGFGVLTGTLTLAVGLKSSFLGHPFGSCMTTLRILI